MEEDLIPLDFDPFDDTETLVEPDKPVRVIPGITPTPAPVPTTGPAPAEPVNPVPPPTARQVIDQDLIPLDYDPFGEEEGGSLLPEIGKGVAAGAVETAGTILKGAAGQRVATQHQVRQEEARAKVLKELGYDGTVVIEDLPPEKQKQLREALTAANAGVQPPKEILEDPWYKAGQATVDWSEDQFKAAKDYEDSWTRAISSGLGSTLPFMAAGLLGPGGGTVVGAGAGMFASSGEALDRAIQAGASKEDILQAVRLGGLPGVTEQVPIELMLERIPLPMVGRFSNVLAKIFAKASVEGGQEAVQQAAQNFIANYVYDPEQDIGEGVFEAAVIGAAVGGILGTATTRPAARAPKEGIEDEENVEQAGEARPEGVAPTSPAAGQPTPGGLGQVPPPPPGAPAIATEPAAPIEPTAPPARRTRKAKATAPNVIPEGAVDPAIAAALPTEPVAGTPAQPEQPPVAPVAPVPTAIPAEEEAEDIYDPAVDEDDDLDLAAIKSAQSAMLEIIRQQETQRASEALVPAPAGDDIAAALATEVPQAVMPEPIGTPEARARREAPVPVTVPPAPVAPIQPAVQEPASPPSPPPAPVPEISLEPVQTQGAPEAVLVQPTAPSAPAPAPVPGVANFSPSPAPVLTGRSGLVSRMLADELRQQARTSVNPILESPDTNMVIDEVAREMAAGFEDVRGVAPNQALMQLRDQAAQEVLARLEQRQAATAQQEVAATEQALQRSAETSREAKITGAPQERERTGRRKGKSAAAAATESELTTRRAVAREMEKPEAERDADLVEVGRLLERRKQVSKKQKPIVTKAIQEVKERRAARLAAEEKAKAPPPKPTAALPVPAQQTEVTTASAPEHERNVKVKKALGDVFDTTPELNLTRVTSGAQLRDVARTYIQNLVTSLNTAMRQHGNQKLREQIAFDKNTPEENVAIFIKKLQSRREEYPGQNGTEAWEAMLYLTGYRRGDRGMLDELRALITNEPIDARPLDEKTIDKLVAPDLYVPEEGATFLDAPAPDLRKSADIPAFSIPDNKIITVTPERVLSAYQALREITRETGRDVFRARGLYDIIARMHAKQLRRMVGDVPVIFLDDATLYQIRGREVLGFYTGYTAEQRRQGASPRVYIHNDWYKSASVEQRRSLILHELTHAATHFALDNNLRQTDSAVTSLRRGFEKAILERFRGRVPEPLRYGLTNNHEFLSEAFSNYTFQEHLSSLDVPIGTRFKVAGVSIRPGEKITWWDAFKRVVSNAISTWNFLTRGDSMKNIGSTYLDHILKIYPQVMMPSEAQEDFAFQGYREPGPALRAEYEWAEKRRNQGAESMTHPMDFRPLALDTASAIDSVRHGSRDAWSTSKRTLANLFATTEELKRRSARWFGGTEDNVFTRLADLYLSGQSRRRDYRKPGDILTGRLAQYYSKDREGYRKLADVLHDATVYQVDPSQPLNSDANKHVSKKGNRDAHRRAAHARLSAQWQALPAEAKTIGVDLADHYREMENQRVTKTVRDILQAAMRPKNQGGLGVTLPPGETLENVTDWVMDGSIDRPPPADPANPQAGERTARDEALHKALGKTAKSLTGSKEMRRIRGLYVPLVRWGKYFFTARQPIKTPNGAVVDPSRSDGVHLIFADKKLMNAYTSTTEDQIDRILSEWYDPNTGQKTSKQAQYVDVATRQLVTPVQRFRVIIQDKVMEMRDSQSELEQLRQDYLKQGYKATDVALIDTMLHRNNEILPAQINRLLGNVAQTHPGSNTVAQDSVQGAIVSAYIRQLSGTRAQHRRLKRRNVKGASRDLIHATYTTNAATAGHLANLDQAPLIAKAERELQEFIESGRNAMKGATVQRQSMYAELKKRMNESQTRTEDTTGARLATAVMEVSFVTHLMSPAYSIINAMQPMVTTWPVLTARFGPGAASKAVGQALVDLGAGKIYRTGVAETGREIAAVGRQVPRHAQDYDQLIRQRLGGSEPGFLKVMDRLHELGFGASAGLETPEATEVGKNRAEVVINRVTRVARAMPEAVEAVNRYVTALATYRLAKRARMSEEDAVRLAVTTVEQTQGGYAQENNPAFMSNKWLRLPLQFKKYALMYGQLYYGAMAQMLNPNMSKETRVRAAKSLVGLSAMTLVFAGVGGLPMMEVAKIFMQMAATFGLTDDEWEETENVLQSYYADGFEWLLGKKSNAEFYGEMMARGLTRAIGIDTASRMGNDSMILFGEPKSMQEADVKSWLLDLMIGAPGGMISDMLEAIHEWDFKKAIPQPKMMKDIIKAYTQATEGTVTDAGRQVAPPINLAEAAAQAIGFRPASAARQWEVAGSGTKAVGRKKLMSERTKVMGQWTNASPAERQRIWRTVIKEWNKEHPSKEDRIEMGDLRRSLAARRARERKEKRDG